MNEDRYWGCLRKLESRISRNDFVTSGTRCPNIVVSIIIFRNGHRAPQLFETIGLLVCLIKQACAGKPLLGKGVSSNSADRVRFCPVLERDLSEPLSF